MNYHNITHDDMNNGDGLRVVLWVAGCNHHCKDCQNPVTWNPADGIPFGLQDKEELYRELKKELGDCLWMIAEACFALDFSMDEVMQLNIDKLKARYPEGFTAERSLHRKAGDV